MTVAELVLAEKIDLVDGSRRLVHLFHGLDAKEWDGDLFDPIVAFTARADDPSVDLDDLGKDRGRVLEICRSLIARYEKEPGEET